MKYLWPLADLEKDIRIKGLDSNRPSKEITDLIRLLNFLHSCAIQTGVVNFPVPAIDCDPDYGLELEWFYKKKKRSLSVSMDGNLRLLFISNEYHSRSVKNIDKQELIDYMLWVYGAKSFPYELKRTYGKTNK